MLNILFHRYIGIDYSGAQTYLHKIRQWQELGYHVKLLLLSLPNADVAIARVAAHVSQGGHNIPEKLFAEDLMPV